MLRKDLKGPWEEERAAAALSAQSSTGLFWELSPGPLAPEARIMPLDQTANNFSEPGAASIAGRSYGQDRLKGLFWELSPGPLAPRARIIPLDQTAIGNNEVIDSNETNRRTLLKQMILARLELAIFGSEDQRLIH